jgi:glycosyltransferase involved in cell wall biosynthesis
VPHLLNGMRIAQLIETDGPGGAERVVIELALALQRAGAVGVVLVRDGGEGWIGRELEGSGVVVESIACGRPISIAYGRALSDALRRHRIEVAHSHEFSMAVYGAWAARRAGIPHIITMHGSRYYAKRLRRRVALRAAVASSAHTVAVSHPYAAVMARDLLIRAPRILTVPNGLRHVPPRRVTLRRELGLRPDDCLAVAVGNLYPVKGHRHLIDALARLAERRPRLHVAVCGRGELHDALLTRAAAHGLADRVHLLGLRSDVPAVLAAADLFVLPSMSEGLPMALLEAMFAGCPIVASDVGDVGAALADGDAGVLVPAGDARALAAALDRLVGDPACAAALGRRAARRARAEYDVGRMLSRYADLYRAALDGAAPARRVPSTAVPSMPEPL